MRLWWNARTIVGCLCLVATLLLMSPGVRAVRDADGAEAAGTVRVEAESPPPAARER
ncbi:MAG: hypothetical protein OEM05_01485 [Myxococcales bacterium]|nr:hypothetical protein [Myxococcales bacterium]